MDGKRALEVAISVLKQIHLPAGQLHDEETVGK
jgi:hypothetical protein